MRHPGADQVAIEALRDREMAALNSGITDSVVAVFADDILIMPNNGVAVIGIAAARAWLDTSFGQVTMTGRYASSPVEVSGDLAVDHFTGELTVTFKAPGAAPITEAIKGIRVYRRQANDSWKITKAIWNPDQSLPVPGR